MVMQLANGASWYLRVTIMTMDVMGKHPTTEAGEYFRRSVWCWHPLAEFCCSDVSSHHGELWEFAY